MQVKSFLRLLGIPNRTAKANMNVSDIKSILRRIQSSTIPAVASTYFARIVSGGLQYLLIAVVLGRIVGAAGVGIFLLYLSWLQITATFGAFGYPTLSLRAIAKALERNDYFEAYRYWKRSLVVPFLGTLIVAIFGYVWRNPIAGLIFRDLELGWLVTVITGSAVPMAVLLVATSVLKGQGKPVLGLFLQFGAAPLLLLLGLMTYQLSFEGPVSIGGLIVGFAIALVFVALISVGIADYALRIIRRGAKFSESDPSVSSELGTTVQASRFWLIDLSNQANLRVPIILVSFFASPEEVGYFGVSYQLVAQVGILFTALQSVYSPIFVREFARRKATLLRRYFFQTRFYAVSLYLPIFLVFVGAGKFFLGLSGPEFIQAFPLVIILAAGQLIKSSMGLGEFFNLMTDAERFEIFASFSTLVLTLTLGILLGSNWETVGIAVAVSITLAFKNLISVVRANRTIRRLEVPVP